MTEDMEALQRRLLCLQIVETERRIDALPPALEIGTTQAEVQAFHRAERARLIQVADAELAKWEDKWRRKPEPAHEPPRLRKTAARSKKRRKS